MVTRGQTMADPGLGPETPRPAPVGDHPHGLLETHSRRPDAPLLAVGGFAVVSALATLAVNAAYNHGHVVPPLDDVYIHLQYARQIGLGEFLRYQPGAPATTGASSLLYVLLLGVAAVVVPRDCCSTSRWPSGWGASPAPPCSSPCSAAASRHAVREPSRPS